MPLASMADVSVVVPAYNQGSRLAWFLVPPHAAGARHPHPRLEFVVVDDGSRQDGLPLVR